MKELLEGLADSLAQVIHLVTVQHQTLVLLVEQNQQLVNQLLEQSAPPGASDEGEEGMVYDLSGKRVK